MSSLEESIENIKISMSKYCLEQCINTCCEFTLNELDLSKDELRLLYEDKIKESRLYRISAWLGFKNNFDTLFEIKISSLIKNKILKKRQDGIYVLKNGVCPRYEAETKECTIYPSRPFNCKKFPISLDDSNVNFSVFCQYVRENHESIVKVLIKNNRDELIKHKIHFIMNTGLEYGERCYSSIELGRYDIIKKPHIVKQKVKEMQQKLDKIR